MEPKNENVIAFSDHVNKDDIIGDEVSQEETEETAEDIFGGLSMRQIESMIKQAGDMVKTMEQSWTISQRDYKLTDEHMKAIYDYHTKHAEAMPEGLSKDEQAKWDRFKDLDTIPDEEIDKIFGKEHPIYGVSYDVTRDRIKYAFVDFFNYMCAMREYKNIHDAYITLLNAQEEKNIKELQLIIDNEKDLEKKAVLQKELDKYYYTKNLDFLAEPLPESEIDELVSNFYDSKKLEYYINRAQDKLKQIRISTGVILEISQFEKRFLGDEKYIKLNNMLLLYFMKKLIFSGISSDKPSIAKTEIVAMVMALDGLCRNVCGEKDKSIFLNNIKAFEDQFLDKVPDKTDTEASSN